MSVQTFVFWISNGHRNYAMGVFVVVIKGANVLWLLNSDMFPILGPRVCGKFNLCSNFLEMSSHSAFVNGTFTNRCHLSNNSFRATFYNIWYCIQRDFVLKAQKIGKVRMSPNCVGSVHVSHSIQLDWSRQVFLGVKLDPSQYQFKIRHIHSEHFSKSSTIFYPYLSCDVVEVSPLSSPFLLFSSFPSGGFQVYKCSYIRHFELWKE